MRSVSKEKLFVKRQGENKETIESKKHYIISFNDKVRKNQIKQKDNEIDELKKKEIEIERLNKDMLSINNTVLELEKRFSTDEKMSLRV